MKYCSIFFVGDAFKRILLMTIILFFIPQNLYSSRYSSKFYEFISLTDKLYVSSKGWNFNMVKKEYPILLSEFLGHSLRMQYFHSINDKNYKKIFDGIYSETNRYMDEIVSFCGFRDSTGRRINKQILWQRVLFAFNGGLDDNFIRNYNLTVSTAPSIFNNSSVPGKNGLPIIKPLVPPSGKNLTMMGVPYSGDASNSHVKDTGNKNVISKSISPDALIGSWEKMFKGKHTPCGWQVVFRKTGQTYTAYLIKHTGSSYETNTYCINKPIYIAKYLKTAKFREMGKNRYAVKYNLKLLDCKKVNNRNVRVYDEDHLWLSIDDKGLYFEIPSGNTYWRKLN